MGSHLLEHGQLTSGYIAEDNDSPSPSRHQLAVNPKGGPLSLLDDRFMGPPSCAENTATVSSWVCARLMCGRCLLTVMFNCLLA